MNSSMLRNIDIDWLCAARMHHARLTLLRVQFKMSLKAASLRPNG
jgi:hypothetical protein